MRRPSALLPALLAMTLTAVTLTAVTLPAAADSRLEIRYAGSFTGIPVGQGALMVEFGRDGYSAAGSAAVTGMLKLITPGKGSAAARGQMKDGKVVPASYSVSSESGKRSQDVRMALANGGVSEFSIEPRRSSSNRVPVTDEHLKNVVDPMSAALMPVAGTEPITGTAACDRTIPIFDGQYRYDLVLSHVRNETAKDISGYSGPLFVCDVDYRPIAGHRDRRRRAEESAETMTAQIWLAIVPGTRIVMPARVVINTMLGAAVVQATRFSTEARERPEGGPAVR